MESALQRAFDEAAKLPSSQQEKFAEFLLAELEDEQEWNRAFASSPESLEKLAEAALDEHRAGKTKKLRL